MSMLMVTDAISLCGCFCNYYIYYPVVPLQMLNLYRHLRSIDMFVIQPAAIALETIESLFQGMEKSFFRLKRETPSRVSQYHP